MDIFDVLNAVSISKDEFIRKGMNEHEALLKAVHSISVEYNIHLLDVEKLVGNI